MKNKKIMIEFIMILVLIIVIVLGILYLFTDVLKTNQQIFYKYFSKMQIVDENLTSKCSYINDKIRSNNFSSSTNLEILKLTQNSGSEINDIQEVVSIESKGLTNRSSEQTYREYSFFNNEQEFLKLKYIKDGNTYAVGADNILVKYLAVENSNLKDLCIKLGMEDSSQIPDSIQVDKNKEIFYIEKEILEQLKTTYLTVITDNLKEENFYNGINDDETRTIGFSLSEQEVSDIIYEILEKVQSDNTIMNLIVNKAELLGYNNINIESLNKNIETLKEELSKNTYMVEQDFFRCSIIKKKDNVIKLKFEINYRENDSLETEENVIVEKNNLSLEIDFSESNKRTIAVKENETELIKIDINYICYDANMVINCEITSSEVIEEEFVSIKVKYKIDNYQTDNIIENCVIEVTDPNDEFIYQINLLNNIILKQEVQITRLTSENSAKLNDMTSEELSQLYVELENRINELYGEKLFVENSIIEKAEKAQEDYEETLKEEQENVQQAEQQLQEILNGMHTTQ